VLRAAGSPLTLSVLTTFAHRSSVARRANGQPAPRCDDISITEAPTGITRAFEVDEVEGQTEGDAVMIKSYDLTPARPELWQVAGAHWAHSEGRRSSPGRDAGRRDPAPQQHGHGDDVGRDTPALPPRAPGGDVVEASAG